MNFRKTKANISRGREKSCGSGPPAFHIPLLSMRPRKDENNIDISRILSFCTYKFFIEFELRIYSIYSTRENILILWTNKKVIHRFENKFLYALSFNFRVATLERFIISESNISFLNLYSVFIMSDLAKKYLLRDR